jgi:hypothetical protein
VAHATQSVIDERVTRLEEFEKQQKDYNNFMDHLISTRNADLARVQGNQDEKIAVVQANQQTYSTVGQIGGWLFGVVMSVFFYVGTQRHADAKHRDQTIQVSLSALESRCMRIEKKLIMIAPHMHVDDEE